MKLPEPRRVKRSEKRNESDDAAAHGLVKNGTVPLHVLGIRARGKTKSNERR